MAEEKTAVPVTKFFVPDSVRTDIFNIYNANGFISQASSAISELEDTGKITEIPEKVKSQITSLTQNIKSFYDGALTEYNKLKTNESKLDLHGLNQLRGLAEAINAGDVDFEGL